MSRRRNNRQLNIKLPVTVRQAQKLINNYSISLAPLLKALRLDIYDRDRIELKKVLDRMAQANPNFLIQEEEPTEAGADSPSADDTEEAAAENREAGESRTKGTDEVAPQSENPLENSEMHGGDGNSGECEAPAQTDSQQQQSQSQPGEPGHDSPSGNGLGDGVPQDGENRSACDAPQPSGSETGSNATSEGTGQGGNAQSSNRQSVASPSMATGEGDRNGDKSTMHPPLNSQPHDADIQESGDSHSTEVTDAPERSGEGDRANDGSEDCSGVSAEKIENGIGEDDRLRNQPGDDSPTHQKKWGKKFGKTEKSKLSASANTNHGGVTADLKSVGVNANLLKLCRQRLAALVGDSSQEYSPRRDYREFCVRLQTYRNPQPARKEEYGRPVILILADVSGSCASFSDQSVAVAKAASKLGVPGADVLVLSHSNGYPCELEHNGKPILIESVCKLSGCEHAHNNAAWYEALTQRFQIQACIALGDWDAADDYVQLMLHPVVERFIWLDNAHCSSRGTVKNRTKKALSQIDGQQLGKVFSIQHKLVYRDGCKDAISFIENIRV